MPESVIGVVASEDGPSPQGVYSVLVNHRLVIASPCDHVCKRAARILDQARAADYRDAMRFLTTDLGMCDEVAEIIYMELRTEGKRAN